MQVTVHIGVIEASGIPTKLNNYVFCQVNSLSYYRRLIQSEVLVRSAVVQPTLAIILNHGFAWHGKSDRENALVWLCQSSGIVNHVVIFPQVISNYGNHSYLVVVNHSFKL